MSVSKRRVDTMRLLTADAQNRSGLAGFHQVDHELQEAERSKSVKPERRRHLLQIFHGMRALETALGEVVRSHGSLPERSLGGLLHQLSNFSASHPAHLSSSLKGHYLRNVKDPRNRYMHEANTFPNSAREADQIMGEITACFAQIVR